ncbi:nucleotidyltransferase family protein [Metabacillus litoralis]|jgi:hypothetical protein|uniref:nucleotidyltransferase domain-containing protein n=1 Tax=Metabacillus litoralis TaxID=152268 RepID=UPI00203EEDEA|nr:nucleotidyltransferase family protein [Metabacillus litoralis]MCM3650405.1 nucleotidyltransferase family protein [Metabacillus litoralis]
MDNNFKLNLTNVPKELRLILEILKSDNADYSQLCSTELLNNINWEHFIEQTMHHRIYPLLYPKLKSLDENLIPSYVIQNLYQKYKQNTFNMLHLSAEMEKVSKVFTEDKISLLFLKGPVIAHDLYGDISLRTSSDLDFLIPIDELEKAESLLINLGYVKDDYIETVLNDWKWRHHHVTYFHPQKRIKLEIHWRLNPGPGKEPSFHDLWERKRKCKLTSFPVYLLGKEDLFLFLVSHGARHGWSRLRWLVDIHQIMEQGIVWERAFKLLKTYHYRQVGAQALILATQLFNTKKIDEINPLLKSERSQGLAQEAIFYLERMVNLHNDPVPEDVSLYHSRHLFSLMSKRQKALFILSFLHPYPEDAKILPLPKQLHFLYFPLRPFLWALRKKRKHALP